MMKETEDVVHMSLDFLPLKSYANITEGNALRLDWESVVPKQELNYIMGFKHRPENGGADGRPVKVPAGLFQQEIFQLLGKGRDFDILIAEQPAPAAPATF